MKTLACRLNVKRGCDSSPPVQTPHVHTRPIFSTLLPTAIEKGKGKAKKGSSFQTVSALHRVSVWPSATPVPLAPCLVHPQLLPLSLFRPFLILSTLSSLPFICWPRLPLLSHLTSFHCRSCLPSSPSPRLP